MKIPFNYITRNLQTRRLTTGMTILGVGLVVFVFAAVLMMAYGVQKTLVSTGTTDNVLVSRKASNGEISSIIDGETANIILSMDQVARTPDGHPLATKDVVTVINFPKIGLGGMTNVTVRGVGEQVFVIRPDVKIVEGRMFNRGAREVIVGSATAQRIEGAQIGSLLKFGGDQWTVVGQFDAGGSGFDSEIWGDVTQLTDALGRPNVFSTVTFRLRSQGDFEAFKSAFNKDNRLQAFIPKPEKQFFEEQSETMALFIRVLGIFITFVFSFGAAIGAMITMYAAVANRTREIGTMRAIGFRRRSVLGAYLVEALLISVLGGVLGLLLASFLSFFSISTLNFDSFSEIQFSFALSPNIVAWSLLFALLMGLVGGFLPSVRAARLNILNALRGE